MVLNFPFIDIWKYLSSPAAPVKEIDEAQPPKFKRVPKFKAKDISDFYVTNGPEIFRLRKKSLRLVKVAVVSQMTSIELKVLFS